MLQEVFLSIIVPVYNEEEILEASLQNKLSVLQQYSGPCQLIVVNDASADNSEKKILAARQNAPSHINFTYVKNETNLGFGGAVKAGIAASTGQNILCLPADLFIEPTKANEIISALQHSDVVVCYRESKPGNSFVSIMGSAIYQGLIRIIYGLKLRDINWVHAYRRSIFTEKDVTPLSNRIFFLAEVLILAHRKKLSITELALPQQERKNRKGTSQSFGTFVKAMSDLVGFMFR